MMKNYAIMRRRYKSFILQDYVQVKSEFWTGRISTLITVGWLSDENSPLHLQPLFFACPKSGGGLLATQNLKYCNKIVQKNLPELLHFHCLRHTCVSALVNHGVNFKAVQMLLGHSDIKIMMNACSHVNNEARKKTINILEAAVTS